MEKLSKSLVARGESKNGEFRDSANARLTNFCQNVEKTKLQDAKGKKEEAKEAKKEAAPAAETDFTQVKGGNRQKQKQGQGSTKSGREKPNTAWAECQLPEDTKLIEEATGEEAKILHRGDPTDEASGYVFVKFEKLQGSVSCSLRPRRM